MHNTFGNQENLCKALFARLTKVFPAFAVKVEQQDDLYILAAYPHIDPLAAIILYEDERAQVLAAWCAEHGCPAPEQGDDELDPPYWHRLMNWFNENTSFDADQILTSLVREQLRADFSPEDEYKDALEELQDLAQGIVRLPPEDDDEPAQNE